MYYTHPSEFTKITVNERNNCAPVALAVAFGIPYEYAKAFAIENWNYSDKGGSPTCKIIESFEAGIPIFDKQAKRVISTQDYKQGNGLIITRRMKVGTFLGKYPTGTYFLLVAKHALAVVDGKLVDHIISLDRRIEGAWAIQSANLPMVIPAELPTSEADILEEFTGLEEVELPTTVEVILKETPNVEVIEVSTKKRGTKKRKEPTSEVIISE